MTRFAIIPAAAVTDDAIGPAALRVLLVLGTHTDKNGWCRVGQSTIAERLGVRNTAVSNQIQALVDAGYVEVKRTGRTSMYRILFDPERGDMDDSTRNGIDPDDDTVIPRDDTSDSTRNGIDRTNPSERKEPTGASDDAPCDPPSSMNDLPTVAAISDRGMSYPPSFLRCWVEYPSRPNNSKKEAYRAWRKSVDRYHRAKRAQGSTVASVTFWMCEATKQYARWCEENVTDERHIKQAATFYGPDEHWIEYAAHAKRDGVTYDPEAIPE